MAVGRSIIIVTVPGSQEWDLAVASAANRQDAAWGDAGAQGTAAWGPGFAEVAGEARVIGFELGPDRVVLVNQERFGVEELLREVVGKEPTAERYVAVHDLDHYAPDRAALKASARSLSGFRHTSDYAAYLDAVVELLKAIGSRSEKTADCYGSVIRQIGRLTPQEIGRSAVALHGYLMRLLLPIALDCRGLTALSDWERRRAYAADTIEDQIRRGAGTHFTRFAKARSLVLGTEGSARGGHCEANDAPAPSGRREDRCLRVLVGQLGEDLSALPDLFAQKRVVHFLEALDHAVEDRRPERFARVIVEGADGFDGRSFELWVVRLDEVVGELVQRLLRE